MFQPGLLRDQVIIVTGGGSGLGKSMAARFGELGARLVLAGRTVERLTAAAQEIRAACGAEVLPVAADVRDPAAMERMVAEVVARFGRIDGLVNNAAGNFLCAAEDLSPNGFSAVVDIVLKGSFFATQAVGKQLIAQGGGGSILSILTTYAWTGSAFVLPSAMAKAGVLAMTRSLAVEWGSAYRIRANAIAPGPFPTEGAWSRLAPGGLADAESMAKERIPLGRLGEHAELANLAAFLMSPGSAFINGECVAIDGGEWLMGAGEFNAFTRADRGQMRQVMAAMRPKRA